MRLLALESSTDWLSVAAGDGERWSVRAEAAGTAASERALPLAQEILAEAGWRVNDLDAIAFGAGPGSFTGVRIACGLAQGLALGADLPVIGIGTLLALAHGARRIAGVPCVLACLDARMREVYAAAYCHGDDGWIEVHAPAVLPPSQLRVPEGAWHGAGDGYERYPDLAPRLGLRGVADVHPSALDVGMLALPRLAAGERPRADDAQPMYVRQRVALTTAERDAGLRL